MDTRHHKELCVLACMYEPAAFELVASCLTAGDFAHLEHKQIFRAIVELYDRQEVDRWVDSVKLLDLCNAKGYEVRWQTLVEAHELQYQSSTVTYHCQRLLAESRLDKLRALGERITVTTDSSDEFIEQQIRALEAIRENSMKLPIVTAAEALDRMETARQNPAKRQATGFRSMDQTLRGGIRDGQLIVIGGRPGAGKTALMAQLAANASRNGRPSMIVSLEIPVDEFAERLTTSIDKQVIRSMPLYFSDQVFGLDKICSLAKVAKRRHQISLLVVDYLQLVNADLGGRSSREEQVAHCSRTFKRLALELQIPVVVGSQLNRESEKGAKEPKLSDLRESGAIEQDADLVFLLSREDPREPKAVVNLAKHRGGPVQRFEMDLIGREFRFEERQGGEDVPTHFNF